MRGNKRILTEVVGVRFKLEDKRLLKEVCTARGEDVSDFVRRATRKELATMGYYSRDVAKSLGVAVK